MALEVAEAIGGEIVSVDSMQVYRGLDIGTAKPSMEERARAPHHLIDVAGLEENFSAADWLARAKEVVAEIQARGRRAIFCGGTGLYFRAWFEGLTAGPPPPASLRQELESMALPDLVAELRARDPQAAERVDLQNPRRVIRALEILRMTGGPLPEREPAGPAGERIFVLRRSSEDLRRRIEERVDAMFARGLMEETRHLAARGLAANRTACQAIGYRQALECLNGERDFAATIALVKVKTWQYARRQMTWFRNQFAAEWVDVAPDESPRATAEAILRRSGGAQDSAREGPKDPAGIPER